MSETEKHQAMVYGMPKDDRYLAMVGSVAIAHAHLDHCLRMMTKTLADVSVAEAMNATAYDGSRYLRDQVKKLGRQRLGVGQAFIKLKALLFRCEQLTDERNELLHEIFTMELVEGEVFVQKKNLEIVEPPSYEALQELYVKLRTLVNELNRERLDGFISAALD